MDSKKVETTWKRYKKSPTIEDRDLLIVHYLHLVKFVVGRVAAGLPEHIKEDDLYSSGITGLIKAVEKFDPSMNNKFETYASLLIKGAIIDELRHLDWIPRSVHQKANQIADTQNVLQRKLGREPSDEEISKELGLSELEFYEMLARIRPAILIPLDADLSSNGEEGITLSEKIPDSRAETGCDIANRREFQKILENAIDQLPDQEKEVLKLYYFEELMLKEIGKIMGISESRVSQIHTKALLKLRKRLRDFSDSLKPL